MKANYLWVSCIIMLLVINIAVFIYLQKLFDTTETTSHNQGWTEVKQIDLELEHERVQIQAQRNMMDWLRGKD